MMKSKLHAWVSHKNKKTPEYSFLEYVGVDFGMTILIDVRFF